MTLRNALRAGTSEYHTVVDDLFGRFDLSNRGQYSAFLSGHARVIAAAERALEQGGIQRLIPDWAERRRADLLSADMAALGIAEPPPVEIGSFSSSDELWGAVYVLEGSKLGGAMLSKRVPDHFPSAYLSYQGPKGAMKAFMDQLDAATVDRQRAIAAACAVFAAFRAAAERELEVCIT